MPATLEMRERVLRKSRQSAETQEQFFSECADRIAACAAAMAAAFDAGGKLLVMGNGGSSCDAQHMSVEFMHPILEKRPALPAVALATEPALLTAVGNDQDFSLALAGQLGMLARKGDIALAISTSGRSAGIVRALQEARARGCLTVGFAGRDGGRMVDLCNHCFVVPSFNIHRIQEAHGTLVHILWDLIHIHRGQEDVL